MKKNAFVILFFCMCLVSCEKEKIENQISIKNDPYLEFSDFNAFLEGMEMGIGAKSGQTSGKFQSFVDVYYEFLDKINDSTITYQQYTALLDEYQDVIVIEDDMITAKIDNPLVTQIVNRHGIVKIGETLVKYSNTEKIISLNGDMELLLEAASTQKALEGIERISLYSSDVKSSFVSCGWDHKTDWMYNSSRNRRARVRTYIYDDGNPSGIYESGVQLYDFVSYSISYGESQMKNVFGNWVNVKTRHTLDLTFIGVTGSTHYTYVNNQVTQNSSDAYTLTKWNHLRSGRAPLNQQGNYQSIYYQINKIRYTNRGFDSSDPRWIEIQCGFSSGW